MRTTLSTLLALAFVLALHGCDGPGQVQADDDDAADDDAVDDDAADDDAADDDATDDDDDATGDDDVADDDVADDDDMGPCESGICELVEIEATVGCDMLPDPDPFPPGGVLAASPAPGQLMVMHFDHSMGCCPQIHVLGLATMNDQHIEIEVDLYDDFCDCICTLDVQYTLGDVPAGIWTVFGQTVEVL